MDEIKEYNDANEICFEDFKNQNGITFWWASELMLMLGYDDMMAFRKVIDKTTKAFISLGIDHYENIIYTEREVDGNTIPDFKLTRFACYLVAMNANPQKTEVANMQAYFAIQTRKFELYFEDNNDLDRLVIRDEIKEGNKQLASTVNKHGIEDFAKFCNAGYLGMYNMQNWQLAKRRKCDPKKLLETMGRTELAANLFRITQTEERIKHYNVNGQNALEKTHYDVGREVRNMVIRNTGKSPENLPQEKKLPEVKKVLKTGFREMKKLDKPQKK